MEILEQIKRKEKKSFNTDEMDEFLMKLSEKTIPTTTRKKGRIVSMEIWIAASIALLFSLSHLFLEKKTSDEKIQHALNQLSKNEIKSYLEKEIHLITTDELVAHMNDSISIKPTLKPILIEQKSIHQDVAKTIEIRDESIDKNDIIDYLLEEDELEIM